MATSINTIKKIDSENVEIIINGISNVKMHNGGYYGVTGNVELIVNDKESGNKLCKMINYRMELPACTDDSIYDYYYEDEEVLKEIG